MIRIVITDDHQIVIDGLVQLLSNAEGVEVVGQANSGEEALSILGNRPVDVILLDIDMQGMNGIQACKVITRDFPNTAVVALSMIEEPSIVRNMLEAGALGYLMKNCGKDELLKCIQTVHRGKSYYSEEVADIILRDISGRKQTHSPKPLRLSRREKQVLQLIADEMTTREVSKQLGISFGTVETHRRNIMQKLGARNVVGMIRIAIEHGLLE